MADTESTAPTYFADDHDDCKLCASCEELDLSVHQFIIGKPGVLQQGSRPPSENGFPSLKESEPKRLHLSSGGPKKAFAMFNQVQERRESCRFCDLLFRAVGRYSRDQARDTTRLHLTWEVDGRQIASSGHVVNRTRRIRLSWHENDGREQDVYLVFVAPTGLRRSNSDAHITPAMDISFLGRGLIDSKEKPALMMSWIDLCVKKHGKECQNKFSSEKEFKKLIKGTHFGVIDVVDMNLKELPFNKDNEPERYVALSYVWSKQPVGESTYMTTRSNVMIRIQRGGLEEAWDKLPRTIQNAILLVGRLGERYLWIDSLCIVQDSTSSWELNAKAMHLVYGNAHFTICAADGDATSGLRAVDPILSTVQPGDSWITPMTASVSISKGKGTESRSIDETQSAPLTAECRPGVRLLASKPPEAVIQDSLWNERGWTFQERLLSRRCLIFADGQVYFQCRSAVMSQDIFTEVMGNGWSLDWTSSPLRTLSELRRRAFWFYMKCIHLYTGRSLTKSKDVLTAFQGTSWLLQQQLNAPLFYGLPTSHFDLALLWTPLKILDRRKLRTSHSSSSRLCDNDELGNCNCKLEEEDYGGKEFPSWSWCGWMGGKAEYQLEMIEGCLLNVQEWLRNHTWILWFVRDYEGNLRPLWDRDVLYEDLSEDGRWRGYAGRNTDSIQPRRRAVTISTSPPPQKHHVPPTRSKKNLYNQNPQYYSYPGQEPSQYALDEPRNCQYPPGVPPGYDPLWNSPYSRDFAQNPFLPMQRQEPVRKHKRSSGFAATNLTPHKAESSQWSRQPNAAYLDRLPAGYYHGQDDELHTFKWRSGTSKIQESTLHQQSSVDPDYNEPPRPPPLSSRTRDSLMSPALQTRNSEPKNSEEHSASELDSPRTRSTSSSDKDESESQDIRPEKTKNKLVEDIYGRPVRSNVMQGTEFTGILPDNPFGVIRGPFRKNQLRAMPILQFWTWRTELYITIHDSQSLATPNEGLCQCNITDKNRDWCGSITLPRAWVEGRQGTPLIFIALSDAKSFTIEECPVWNYYIPKEKDESEWDLYYVLLLDRNRERAVWERAGLGKVFQAAFNESVWDEIKLG